MDAGRFYVYELIDPRCGAVFYVGKGVGRRSASHDKEARKGVASPKCDRIRSIWQDGLSVSRRVVERFQCEKSAYDAERNLIEKIGLERLTNRVTGGGGINPLVERWRNIARLSEVCKAIVELTPYSGRSLVVAGGSIAFDGILSVWQNEIRRLVAVIGPDVAVTIAAKRGVRII
jgi:hypothetical protein